VERRDFRPCRIFATFFSHLSTARAQSTAVTVCRFYIDEQARRWRKRKASLSWLDASFALEFRDVQSPV
jgi:hypothetical protein